MKWEADYIHRRQNKKSFLLKNPIWLNNNPVANELMETSNEDALTLTHMDK